MTFDKTKATGQVRSLTRALRILRALGARGEGMTLSELAETTGLPPSTTHRLLTTLEAERFVRPDQHGGTWRVGVAAFYVGSAFAGARDKMALARPYLSRLMELTGETSNLFVESDGETVCIGQIESRHAMRAITGVGGRVQMHCSAAGKVLLAFADPIRRNALLSKMAMPALTDHTITTQADLERAIEEVRTLGYAVDDEEHLLGLRCVAAPIIDETGRAAAAISVSGPTARINEQRLLQLGQTVAQVAQEAAREYGGEVPVAAQ